MQLTFYFVQFFQAIYFIDPISYAMQLFHLDLIVLHFVDFVSMTKLRKLCLKSHPPPPPSSDENQWLFCNPNLSGIKIYLYDTTKYIPEEPRQLSNPPIILYFIWKSDVSRMIFSFRRLQYLKRTSGVQDNYASLSRYLLFLKSSDQFLCIKTFRFQQDFHL